MSFANFFSDTQREREEESESCQNIIKKTAIVYYCGIILRSGKQFQKRRKLSTLCKESRLLETSVCLFDQILFLFWSTIKAKQRNHFWQGRHHKTLFWPPYVTESRPSLYARQTWLLIWLTLHGIVTLDLTYVTRYCVNCDFRFDVRYTVLIAFTQQATSSWSSLQGN